jgi:hypothetical protein
MKIWEDVVVIGAFLGALCVSSPYLEFGDDLQPELWIIGALLISWAAGVAVESSTNTRNKNRQRLCIAICWTATSVAAFIWTGGGLATIVMVSISIIATTMISVTSIRAADATETIPDDRQGYTASLDKWKADAQKAGAQYLIVHRKWFGWGRPKPVYVSPGTSLALTKGRLRSTFSEIEATYTIH